MRSGVAARFGIFLAWLSLSSIALADSKKECAELLQATSNTVDVFFTVQGPPKSDTNPFPEIWESAWTANFAPHLAAGDRIRDIIRRGGTEGEIFREMGFRVDAHGELTVPTFEALLQNVDRIGRKNGKTPALRPGIAYRNPNDYADVRFFGYGEKVRDGYLALDSTFLTPDILGKMLAAGYFPISTGRAAHDIFHVAGFLAFPEYAKDVVALQKAYMQGSHLHRADKYNRYAFFLEGFAAVPRANAEGLKKFLGPEFQTGDETGLNLTDLSRKYDARENAVNRREAGLLLLRWREYVDHYGGAAREEGRFYTDVFLVESLSNLSRRVQRALAGDEYYNGTKIDLARDLARFKLALYYSIGMTAADYVAAAKSTVPLAESNPVYRYFVTSGIGRDLLPDGYGPLSTSYAAPQLTPRGVRIRGLQLVVQDAKARHGIQGRDIAASTRLVEPYAVSNDERSHLAVNHAITIGKPIDVLTRELLEVYRGIPHLRQNPTLLFRYLSGTERYEETLDQGSRHYDLQLRLADIAGSFQALRDVGMSRDVDTRVSALMAGFATHGIRPTVDRRSFAVP